MRAILQSPSLHRLATLAARAILYCLAAAPLLASAQAVTAWNVQSIYTHSKQLNELAEANMWTDGTTRLRELQRNATSVQLQSDDRSRAYLIDFSRRAVFTDLNGTSPPDSFVRAGTASGFTVSFLKLIAITPSGHAFAQVTAEEIRKDGISQGWTITPTFWNTAWTTPLSQNDLTYINGWRNVFGTAFTARPETISRNAAAITIPLSPDASKAKAVIDVTTKWGTQGTWAEYVAPVTGKDVGTMTLSITMHSSVARYDMQNQLMTLVQNSPTKWRLNVANRADLGANWTEVARTVNYIDLKPDQESNIYRFWMNGHPIQSKQVGAADSAFYTIPSSTYAVLNANAQWNGQIGAVWENPPAGVSPGFQIVNKTDYPVLVTLEQVGCLYYGIVPPGQVFQRDTGAVWFTIKAAMAPNIKPPTDFDCSINPALYVGSVLFAGATAGAGLAVPAMVFTALGVGASYGIEAAVLASGGTVTEGEAARRLVSFVTTSGVTVGYGMLQPAADTVWQQIANNAARQAGLLFGTHVVEQAANQVNIDAINNDLMQQAMVVGAYAGYPWPWKMKDRIMPRYDIVGGPRMRKLEDGTSLVLKQERPLTILRVN